MKTESDQTSIHGFFLEKVQNNHRIEYFDILDKFNKNSHNIDSKSNIYLKVKNITVCLEKKILVPFLEKDPTTSVVTSKSLMFHPFLEGFYNKPRNVTYVSNTEYYINDLEIDADNIKDNKILKLISNQVIVNKKKLIEGPKTQMLNVNFSYFECIKALLVFDNPQTNYSIFNKNNDCINHFVAGISFNTEKDFVITLEGSEEPHQINYGDSFKIQIVDENNEEIINIKHLYFDFEILIEN